MSETTIDRTDRATGQVVVVPQDVNTVIELANRILGDQLLSVGHLPIAASWTGFREDKVHGWTVDLRIFTDEYSYTRELRVDDLRDAQKAKELIGDVLWEFGQSVSVKVGEQIRQIRNDLRQLLAAGSS